MGSLYIHHDSHGYSDLAPWNVRPLPRRPLPRHYLPEQGGAGTPWCHGNRLCRIHVPRNQCARSCRVQVRSQGEKTQPQTWWVSWCVDCFTQQYLLLGSIYIYIFNIRSIYSKVYLNIFRHLKNSGNPSTTKKIHL